MRHDREVLRKDHILMARCKDKNRAEQVFACYQKYEDLHPILIHSRGQGGQVSVSRRREGTSRSA